MRWFFPLKIKKRVFSQFGFPVPSTSLVVWALLSELSLFGQWKYDTLAWAIVASITIACHILLRDINRQRWSRGQNARDQTQGHKKNPRPRNDFPRTDLLEAKTKDQGHIAQVFSKKGLRAKIASFSRIFSPSQKKGLRAENRKFFFDYSDKKSVMILPNFWQTKTYCFCDDLKTSKLRPKTWLSRPMTKNHWYLEHRTRQMMKFDVEQGKSNELCWYWDKERAMIT